MPFISGNSLRSAGTITRSSTENSRTATAAFRKGCVLDLVLESPCAGSLLMTFPPLALVRQSIPQPRVDDIPATVRALILQSRIKERVPRGGTIAVGVGSRGITRIPTVAKRDRRHAQGDGVPSIHRRDGEPRRATKEGQAELLAATASLPRRWAFRSEARWRPSSWGPTPLACRSILIRTHMKPMGLFSSTG